MDYKELIKRLKNAAGGPEGVAMCNDAATVITYLLARAEAAEARAEKAERERDAAVNDISDIFTSIDNIRERVGIYNADADNEIADLCAGYCLNAGPMCYKRGESCKCENFKWRGKLEE